MWILHAANLAKPVYSGWVMKASLTRFAFLQGVLVAFLSLTNMSAHADVRSVCLAKGAAMDLAAKTTYQQALRDLAVAKRSDFKFLADNNRDFQITLAQLRAAQIAWLAQVQPQRIVTDQGPANFTNYNWSPEDDEAFIAADPGHASLSNSADRWRRKNDRSKVWPAFRSWFRREVAPTPEFEALTHTLTEARADLATHLSSCGGQ